ncbi:hypothetical protein [Vibrio metschnikovii]|uniref:hypothetical protein n=1 Tax=Vibrio metschnikovii TaxID=28172 RepID=UPI002FC59EE6
MNEHSSLVWNLGIENPRLKPASDNAFSVSCAYYAYVCSFPPVMLSRDKHCSILHAAHYLPPFFSDPH